MSDGKFVVTHDAIIDGTEYTPRPGLLYEIAPGVLARLKPATEGTIEAEEAFDEVYQEAEERYRPIIQKGGTDAIKAYRELQRASRRNTYERCAVVLDVVEGGFDFERDRDAIIFPVASRAVQDFFSVKREILSAQMQSYQELLYQMRKQLGSLSAQAENESPDGAPESRPHESPPLPNGPSGSSSEAGAGSSVPAASVTVEAGSTAPSA